MLGECLTLRRNLDNPFDLAATLSTRSLVMLHAGETDEARKDESEAVRIFRTLEHRVGEAMALLHLAQIDAYVDNDDEARRLIEEAISIAREIGYAEVEGEAELTLGQIELKHGNVDGALARFDRSQEVCHGAEDKRGQAAAMWWLAKVDLSRGDLDRARARLAEALRAFHAFEMNVEMVGCLEDFGELMLHGESAVGSAGFFGAAASLRERLSLPRSRRNDAHWTGLVARARALAGDAPFDKAFASGRNWATGDAVEYALTSERSEIAA